MKKIMIILVALSVLGSVSACGVKGGLKHPKSESSASLVAGKSL